jgi:hypothetical protein
MDNANGLRFLASKHRNFGLCSLYRRITPFPRTQGIIIPVWNYWFHIPSHRYQAKFTMVTRRYSGVSLPSILQTLTVGVSCLLYPGMFLETSESMVHCSIVTPYSKRSTKPVASVVSFSPIFRMWLWMETKRYYLTGETGMLKLLKGSPSRLMRLVASFVALVTRLLKFCSSDPLYTSRRDGRIGNNFLGMEYWGSLSKSQNPRHDQQAVLTSNHDHHGLFIHVAGVMICDQDCDRL